MSEKNPQHSRKRLDPRVPALVASGVAAGHRSLFVVVGDHGRDHVVTLHYLLAKARVSARPSVLWCYKKDLGFSSHRKKRMNQIKKQIARGTREADEDDPFELFVSSTSIRYAYYRETDKILGNTFGMCVLQDFEALTPNLLARTVETVEGGGVVVLLLRTMASLRQLYSLAMDVHARYRTESHQHATARFNERFLLSLGACGACLVLDDELNVLPLSSGKDLKSLSGVASNDASGSSKSLIAIGSPNASDSAELAELKASLKDTQPAGALVACTRTVDQAKAVLTFVDAIVEKTLRSTVALTAARGRGKSAALGIAIAAAVAYGYSNIFITSPSPENLKTLFEFIFKGFDALGFEEHLDYDIIQSTNPAFQKAVVRVNVFRDHRQTIQWIQPNDHAVLAQAELLVIDEAAAIPLPTVRKLLGPYLVFMASTINGYEGTGRSLSLKLIQQLREQSRGVAAAGASASSGVIVGRDGKERPASGAGASSSSASAATSSSSALSGRTLREIKLEEPIRYSVNDPIELWLNKLLCLDCCTPSLNRPRMAAGCPHPSKCELYYVSRDSLFSFHPVSEAFLQMMMSLYVASHYKNSPNDLQLMSDAPAHHLFVLLPPLDESRASSGGSVLPEPLCVVQVCMEGSIARGSALASLARGVRASGDLIPWVVAQQFQDDDFASLSGARVVRIATHPDYVGMGYGARAMEQLEAYYSGQMHSINESDTVEVAEDMPRVTDDDIDRIAASNVSKTNGAPATSSSHLRTERITVRDPSTMPPLLIKLSERPCRERLHWLGVSFGITEQLNRFWKRAGFRPVYLRQTANELTGEHTCIVLKQLDSSVMMPYASDGGAVRVSGMTWLSDFSWDFRRRLIELLSYQLRTFQPSMVLSLFEASGAGGSRTTTVTTTTTTTTTPSSVAEPIVSATQVHRFFTPFDLKRLDSYTQNLLDYHVIVDLIPVLSRMYFMDMLSSSSSSSTTTATTATTTKPIDVPKLSAVQSAILLAMGLQKKTVEDIETDLGLPVSQILALFGKAVKKLSVYLNGLVERGVADDVSRVLMTVNSVSKPVKHDIVGKPGKKKRDDNDNGDDNDNDNDDGDDVAPRSMNDDEAWDPITKPLDDDLNEIGQEAMQAFRQHQKNLINSLNLNNYAINDNDNNTETDTAWNNIKLKQGGSGIINLRNDQSTKRRKLDTHAGTADALMEKVTGGVNGLHDPKNLVGKIKEKREKLKSKRDKKRLQ